MTVVLRTLSENLSEKSDAVPPPAPPSTTAASSDSLSNRDSQGSAGPASNNNLLVLVCMHILTITVALLQGFIEIVNIVWICAVIPS